MGRLQPSLLLLPSHPTRGPLTTVVIAVGTHRRRGGGHWVVLGGRAITVNAGIYRSLIKQIIDIKDFLYIWLQLTSKL